MEHDLKIIAFLGDAFSLGAGGGDDIELSSRGAAGVCLILSELESSIETLYDNVGIMEALRSGKPVKKTPNEEVIENA